jgi:hypothetical protein
VPLRMLAIENLDVRSAVTLDARKLPADHFALRQADDGSVDECSRQAQ